MGTLCRQQQPPAAAPQPGSPRRAGDGAALPASPLLLLLLLLSSSISACNGAPMPSQALEADEDLQLWKEIDDACSAYLSTDSQPQMSSTLEELCFFVMGFLQKPQGLDEKDNTKRFLFHYSKTHDSGNSDIMISGCHIAYLRQTKLGPKKNFKDLEGFKAEATFSTGHAMGGDQWIFAKEDPNEDTEWNDTLRKFGILPPKEKEKDEIEEMVLHLQKEAEVKPYERMNLEELKEAEDDFDEADRKAIEMYRQQRLKEWKCLQRMQKYGELREICGEQYVKEVTNAPEDVWVIIHLYRSSIPVCLLVNEHLSLLARKFPEVKFLKAIVNSCIPNYQDRCLPTILVYKSGEIKSRFIGVSECGGMYLKVEELEWKLAEVGAVETDLEENPRKDITNIMTLSVQNISAHEATNTQRSDVMKPRIA